MDQDAAAAEAPELVRVRLAGHVRPLHLLRWPEGRRTDQDRFPGADLVAAQHGRIPAAYSPQALLRALEPLHGPLQPARTLVLDFVRCRRALQRRPERWTSQERGDLREADDLLWDVAGTLGDETAAHELRFGKLHGVYRLLWGEGIVLLPSEELVRAWVDATTWLSQKLCIIDSHERRHLKHR